MSRRVVASLAIIAVAAGVAASSPRAAADPLSVFQPTQIRPVVTDVHGLRALPPLDDFGTVRGEEFAGMENPASASAAASAAGYALRLPATLPPDIGDEPRFMVTRRVRATFTFRASRAAAWARAQKVALHPVPPGLDGATYTAILSPVSVTFYGTGNPSPHAGGARRGSFLGVVQAPLPVVTARGASLATLAGWFAAQPGVPPALVEQVKAIGDASSTLPLPIPVNVGAMRTVQVDGVSGYAFGDETGIGSLMIWTKNGKLFAVGGTLPESELRAVIDSMRG